MCNGMLAGLVAITAPCAFVDSWAAVADRRHRRRAGRVSACSSGTRGIDDPVGAISVHGVNGLWGVISLGIFANGKYGAGWNGVVRDDVQSRTTAPTACAASSTATPRNSYAQLLDAAVVAVFGFVMAYVWFKLSNLITPDPRQPRDGDRGARRPGDGRLGLSRLHRGQPLGLVTAESHKEASLQGLMKKDRSTHPPFQARRRQGRPEQAASTA